MLKFLFHLIIFWNDFRNKFENVSNGNDGGKKYVYKHIQIGSAAIPFGGHQPVPIVQPNQTVDYIASVDTTIIQPPPPRYQRWRRPKTQFVTRSGALKRNNCFKCPAEIILVAEKGTDSVLVKEFPPVTNCHNQVLSRELYKFETLSGINHQFLLPEGTHSFLLNLRAHGRIEQVCNMKYRVIVNRCPTYTTHNPGLRVKCPLDNLWGSTCSFTCKEGGYISQQPNLRCNDDLEWRGEEPYCHYQCKCFTSFLKAIVVTQNWIFSATADNETTQSTSCILPLPPKHGKFTCDTKSVMDSRTDRLPEGSICRIKCHRHHEIASHLDRYSRFSCMNSHWNSTMMDFCTRTRRKNN